MQRITRKVHKSRKHRVGGKSHKVGGKSRKVARKSRKVARKSRRNNKKGGMLGAVGTAVGTAVLPLTMYKLKQMGDKKYGKSKK
jgi:hypothetical protein